MRIGVDIRSLSEGKLTGVEEYTIQLLKALFGNDRENEYFLFYNSRRATPGIVEALGAGDNVSLKAFNYPNKLLNFYGFPYPATGVYDITRAKDELGYKPEYDLERGIADYLAALKQLGV